jgi:hypothetical protein
MWLIPANYIITATPPSGSIYSPFILSNITITSDQTELISLQYNHATPITTIDLATQHANGTYSDPTTISLSATAASGYTIANTYYKIDGGSKKTYTTPFTVSGDGSHTITYWSVDNSGVQETYSTEIFTINLNQAPHMEPLSGGSINSGDIYAENGSFTDTDSSSWTATVDYGEGAGPQDLILDGQNFSLSHQYSTVGTYTVTVIIRDNQQSTVRAIATVTVNNLAPHINSIASAMIPEGQTYTATGSFSDPDSTSWTATVNYGDDTDHQSLTLSPDKTFTFSHQYKDEGAYTVNIAITDNQGAVGTATAILTVNNAQSSIGTINVSANPIQVNSLLTAGATFTDPGILDTHTATWNWGDGAITPATVLESNGSGSVLDSHVYKTAGVYQIILTIKDDDGATNDQTFQYLSVYNPTAQGLFSAGQKFTSPAGAYSQTPSLTGSVKFGLSYKYQGTVPTGNRAFSMDFNSANLHFNATTVNSLVINNGIGTLTGTGTINGLGNYNFLITGNENTNTIRIQITDQSVIIYDTQPRDSATATPTTPVTAGNVLAH